MCHRQFGFYIPLWQIHEQRVKASSRFSWLSSTSATGVAGERCNGAIPLREAGGNHEVTAVTTVGRSSPTSVPTSPRAGCSYLRYHSYLHLPAPTYLPWLAGWLVCS